MTKIAFLLLTLALAGSAWGHGEFGRAGELKKATRTVNIGMADTMRYTPSELEVKRGETVKFVIRNDGKVNHEMVIGTRETLKEHAEMMNKHPGMHHDETHSAEVAPGRSATLVWQFNRTGTFYFGCFEPGHFEAGMVGKIEVTGNPK